MKRRCLIFYCLTILFACHSEPEWNYKFVESDKYSFSKFISGIKEYPYMASDKKISKIYNGYPLLKVGMSKAEVITLLGEPDSEMFKYKYPDDKKIESSSFGYYLKRTEKELATEQDKVIFVYFNIKGELFWVHSENLGLNDLGGPSSE